MMFCPVIDYLLVKYGNYYLRNMHRSRQIKSNNHIALHDKMRYTFNKMYISIYLYIYLSIYLSICLSIYLYINISVCLSVCLSIYLSIYISGCLSIYESIGLSVCLSVCLSIYLSIYQYIYLFVCLSVCLSIYLFTPMDCVLDTFRLGNALPITVVNILLITFVEYCGFKFTYSLRQVGLLHISNWLNWLGISKTRLKYSIV